MYLSSFFVDYSSCQSWWVNKIPKQLLKNKGQAYEKSSSIDIPFGYCVLIPLSRGQVKFVTSQFITWWTKEYSTPPLCSTLRPDAPKLPLKYYKIFYLYQEAILEEFYLKHVKVLWGVIPFCRYNPKALNFKRSDVWLVLMIMHCLHVLRQLVWPRPFHPWPHPLSNTMLKDTYSYTYKRLWRTLFKLVYVFLIRAESVKIIIILPLYVLIVG